MPIDASTPTKQVLDLCRCPVDWEAIPGFGGECPDALDLLHREWLRTVDSLCVASEDSSLVEDILFDPDCYEAPHSSVIKNLDMRRDKMVSAYESGIGRLGDLNFLRPSDYGKHWSVSGANRNRDNVSRFYCDWEADTLSNLFWSWFDDMLLMDDEFGRYAPIGFVRDVAPLWRTFCSGARVRIAVFVALPVGEMNGIPLDHVAIDLDLASRTVHAYPVSAEQARQIMAPLDVRVIKCREYS